VQSCEDTEKCNVFVWCGNPDGCQNADVDVIPYKSCDLKFSYAIGSGSPNPEVWASGSDVDFTSGVV